MPAAHWHSTTVTKDAAGQDPAQTFLESLPQMQMDDMRQEP
jgi:hypothetical protein